MLELGGHRVQHRHLPGRQSALLTDLIAGRVQFAVLSPIVALSHMQTGKLIATGACRAEALPPLLPGGADHGRAGLPQGDGA